MISTKGRYALRVLIDLAEQDSNRYITLREIAERQELSEKYLEIIVSSLVKAGFLEGMRGKGGGYRLNRAPEEYTVGEILRVTEGDLAPIACLEKEANVCERAQECKTLPMWKKLYDMINNFFDSVSIADLTSNEGGGNEYVI